MIKVFLAACCFLKVSYAYGLDYSLLFSESLLCLFLTGLLCRSFSVKCVVKVEKIWSSLISKFYPNQIWIQLGKVSCFQLSH